MPTIPSSHGGRGPRTHTQEHEQAWKNDSVWMHPSDGVLVAGCATWAQPAITGNRLFVKGVTTLALWTLDW